MKSDRTVGIISEAGDSINITLSIEGEREGAMLMIDGVRYHFERVANNQFISEYQVDDDPNYKPQTDADGYCYVLAPFSE